jgi:hypothetical protein
MTTILAISMTVVNIKSTIRKSIQLGMDGELAVPRNDVPDSSVELDGPEYRVELLVVPTIVDPGTDVAFDTS